MSRADPLVESPAAIVQRINAPVFEDAGFISQLLPTIPPETLFPKHPPVLLPPSFGDLPPAEDVLNQHFVTPVPLYLHALSAREAPRDTRASWQWWVTAAVTTGAAAVAVILYRAWRGK